MEDKLGKKVYFIDMVNKVVNTGVIMSRIISKSGYVVNIIIDPEIQKHSIEENLVFDNVDKASEKLKEFIVIQDKMELDQKEFLESQKAQRELVIGKPEFKELADEYAK